jgi:hypothetical protein
MQAADVIHIRGFNISAFGKPRILPSRLFCFWQFKGPGKKELSQSCLFFDPTAAFGPNYGAIFG